MISSSWWEGSGGFTVESSGKSFGRKSETESVKRKEGKVEAEDGAAAAAVWTAPPAQSDSDCGLFLSSQLHTGSGSCHRRRR